MHLMRIHNVLLSCVWLILIVRTNKVTSQNVTTLVKFLDCPSYIPEGTWARCTCQKINADQSGWVAWYRLLNITTWTLVDTNNKTDLYSVLEITAERSSTTDTQGFFCLIEDVYQPQRPLVYRPIIAYGPDPNSLMMKSESNPDWTFDLCPGESTEMSIFCDVLIGSVYPAPRVSFRVIIDSSEEFIYILDNFTTASNIYRYATTFRPTTSSKAYTVKCSLSNPEFPNIKQELSHSVVVTEPPSTLPVFTISNAGKELTVENGSTSYVAGNSHVSVLCSISGGTPEVSSATVSCDSSQNTQKGTRASLELDATKTSPITCVCQGSHVSGCYNYKSVVYIVAGFQATITNFTANGLSDVLVADRGSQITFSCLAEGMPTPSISFVRPDNVLLIQKEGPELELVYTNVQCDVTNRYYCVVKNGWETSIDLPQRFIDVYVKCVPSLVSQSDQNIKAEVKVGSTATINIQVKSYPQPNSFLLLVPKSNLETAVNKTKYSVSYTPKDRDLPSPYGVVTLTFFDISAQDLLVKEYKFIISNGGQLTVTLSLVEATSPTGNDTLYIAIIVSVGGVLVIVAVVVVIIVYRRRSRNTTSEEIIYDLPGNDDKKSVHMYDTLKSSRKADTASYIEAVDYNNAQSLRSEPEYAEICFGHSRIPQKNVINNTTL